MTNTNDEQNRNLEREATRTSYIRLTNEQKEQLSSIFGNDLIDRLETIQVEQIAGYLKFNLMVN